jgi:hypothetical protein
MHIVHCHGLSFVFNHNSPRKIKLKTISYESCTQILNLKGKWWIKSYNYTAIIPRKQVPDPNSKGNQNINLNSQDQSG